MQILVKGLTAPDHTGTRYTPVYQWCKSEAKALKIIKQALRDGIDTVILKRVREEDYEYLGGR